MIKITEMTASPEKMEKIPEQKGYKDIKPNTDSTVNEAKSHLDSLFDKTDKADKSDKNENIKNCPIEGHNGHYDDERGNSTWRPDGEYIPPQLNPDKLSWRELLDKYGIDGIPFKDGEPDFSKVSKGEAKIEPFSDKRSDNFDKADIDLAEQKGRTPEEVAKWRKDNNYTWHEGRDMETMQKVPNEIHANIPHSGGISEYKKGKGE